MAWFVTLPSGQFLNIDQILTTNSLTTKPRPFLRAYTTAPDPHDFINFYDDDALAVHAYLHSNADIAVPPNEPEEVRPASDE